MRRIFGRGRGRGKDFQEIDEEDAEKTTNNPDEEFDFEKLKKLFASGKTDKEFEELCAGILSRLFIKCYNDENETLSLKSTKDGGKKEADLIAKFWEFCARANQSQEIKEGETREYSDKQNSWFFAERVTKRACDLLSVNFANIIISQHFNTPFLPAGLAKSPALKTLDINKNLFITKIDTGATDKVDCQTCPKLLSLKAENVDKAFCYACITLNSSNTPKATDADYSGCRLLESVIAPEKCEIATNSYTSQFKRLTPEQAQESETKKQDFTPPTSPKAKSVTKVLTKIASQEQLFT